MDWDHTYLGERKTSPQQRALNKRRKTGARFATPKETQARVATILDLMQRGLWVKESIQEHALIWGVSVKRVQQLAAEASRNNG